MWLEGHHALAAELEERFANRRDADTELCGGLVAISAANQRAWTDRRDGVEVLSAMRGVRGRALEAARPQIVRFLTYDRIRDLLERLRARAVARGERLRLFETADQAGKDTDIVVDAQTDPPWPMGGQLGADRGEYRQYTLQALLVSAIS